MLIPRKIVCNNIRVSWTNNWRSNERANIDTSCSATSSKSSASEPGRAQAKGNSMIYRWVVMTPCRRKSHWRTWQDSSNLSSMHLKENIRRANAFDHSMRRDEQRQSVSLVLAEYSLSLDVIPLWLRLTCSNLPWSSWQRYPSLLPFVCRSLNEMIELMMICLSSVSVSLSFSFFSLRR